MTTTKIKSVASSVGNGILSGLTVVAEVHTRNRITEIDLEMAPLQQQINQLQEERDRLEATLIKK